MPETQQLVDALVLANIGVMTVDWVDRDVRVKFGDSMLSSG